MILLKSHFKATASEGRPNFRLGGLFTGGSLVGTVGITSGVSVRKHPGEPNREALLRINCGALFEGQKNRYSGYAFLRSNGERTENDRDVFGDQVMEKRFTATAPRRMGTVRLLPKPFLRLGWHLKTFCFNLKSLR